MLVPIDEQAVDYREPDYTVIHRRERLVEPRVVRGAFGGQVDVCQLTVLVVVADVVVIHRLLSLPPRVRANTGEGLAETLGRSCLSSSRWPSRFRSKSAPGRR